MLRLLLLFAAVAAIYAGSGEMHTITGDGTCYDGSSISNLDAEMKKLGYVPAATKNRRLLGSQHKTYSAPKPGPCPNKLVETAAPEDQWQENVQELAENQVTGSYRCIDRWHRCTDFWCNANCNHNPRFCPPSYCRGVSVPPPPPPPVPPPKPNPLLKCPAGSILGTSFFNEAGVNVHKAYKLVCCPAGCGDCAGNACKSRPGGASSCCGQTITKAQKTCGSPPCVLGDPPPAEDLVELPAPKTELAAATVRGSYRCIDRWHRCTDFWCNANCNHNPRFCPPSYCRGVSVPPPPPPPVPPPKPNPLLKCPAGSILGTSFFNEAGVNVHKAYKLVCCPAGCGDCAGNACKSRPGGASSCCGQTITKAQKTCGSPPCVLGDPPPAE